MKKLFIVLTLFILSLLMTVQTSQASFKQGNSGYYKYLEDVFVLDSTNTSGSIVFKAYQRNSYTTYDFVLGFNDVTYNDFDVYVTLGDFQSDVTYTDILQGYAVFTTIDHGKNLGDYLFQHTDDMDMWVCIGVPSAYSTYLDDIIANTLIYEDTANVTIQDVITRSNLEYMDGYTDGQQFVLDNYINESDSNNDTYGDRSYAQGMIDFDTSGIIDDYKSTTEYQNILDSQYNSGYSAGYDATDAEQAILMSVGGFAGAVISGMIYIAQIPELFGVNMLDVFLIFIVAGASVIILKFVF